jgi:hypothetical protein
VRARVTHLGLPDGGADDLEHPVLQALSLREGEWLLAFPVWAWHWGTPADLPWDNALRLDLPAQVRVAKAAAVAEFVTQVAPLGPLREDAPVLPPYVLARFARSCEVVFT